MSLKEVVLSVSVTPFVGVWIETRGSQEKFILVMSHPSWVCGLKPDTGLRLATGLASHPSWVCGLKRERSGEIRRKAESHPSWVCGLKLQFFDTVVVEICHTLRGCVD